MITRITLIENTGNYQRFSNGNVNFNPVTIIYGENRNGKSTFCDIFHSLALNDPKIIIDRKSIYPSNITSQIQQKVKIQFSTDDDKKEIVAFTNDSWDSPPPDNYQLHVFDQAFIYRNVMASLEASCTFSILKPRQSFIDFSSVSIALGLVIPSKFDLRLT